MTENKKLNKAAEKYAASKLDSHHEIYLTLYRKMNLGLFNGYSLMDAFEAGAEWMSNQGISIDASVVKYDDGLGLDMADEDFLSGKFINGDKVIVQIRKIA